MPRSHCKDPWLGKTFAISSHIGRREVDLEAVSHLVVLVLVRGLARKGRPGRRVRQLRSVARRSADVLPPPIIVQFVALTVAVKSEASLSSLELLGDDAGKGGSLRRVSGQRSGALVLEATSAPVEAVLEAALGVSWCGPVGRSLARGLHDADRMAGANTCPKDSLAGDLR